MSTLALIPPSWWAGIFGILGLLLGSFSNVVRWRVPRRESLLWPGSHCPACSRTLTAADLVPVLSWLALRGRCRTCRTPINWQYPAWETAFGLAGYVAGYLGGPVAGGVSLALFLGGIFVWGYRARAVHDQHGFSMVEALVSVSLIAIGLGATLQIVHVSRLTDRGAWCSSQMVSAGQSVLEDLAMKPRASLQLTGSERHGSFQVDWSLSDPDATVTGRLYQADARVTYVRPIVGAATCGRATDPAPPAVNLSTFIRPS